MSFIRSAGRGKKTARAGLVAVTLAVGSVVGISAASASTVTSYTCTSLAPEICFGLTHNGDTVTEMTVQVKPGESATVLYSAEDSSLLNPPVYTASTSVSGSGWAPPKSWSLDSNDGPHKWCGNANVGDDATDTWTYVTACVNL
jgi:hypothetical protein